MSKKSLHICVIAGEPSGDALGAPLMAALKQKNPEAHFSGVGGTQMQQAGLESLFPMENLSVMGVMEVLPRLPLILRRIKQTVNHIVKTRPDIVVTIDSPDFCFRVVKKLREVMGDDTPKLVHYVAPTVWAWRPERAKNLAGLYDGILCLFPMEPEYFEAEGLRAAFVGHPLIEKGDVSNDFRLQKRLSDQANIVGVFFGSRVGEINRMGPIFRDVLCNLPREKGVQTVIVAPTLPHLEPLVKNMLHGVPFRKIIITTKDDKDSAVAAMDAALATSGTIGLELAVADVPHVIGYKINKLTHMMVKNKITAKYAHLANILLDQKIVPESIQENCNDNHIIETMTPVLSAGDNRKGQKQAFADVRNLLRGANKKPPAEQAADFVLEFLAALKC